MIQILTDRPSQIFDEEVAKDINREIEGCEEWLVRDKGSAALTSYEKGAIRMYLIYKLQKDADHVGAKDPM